jgi:hypothetical protein
VHDSAVASFNLRSANIWPTITSSFSILLHIR